MNNLQDSPAVYTPLVSTVGENVKAIRQRKRLTQAQAATKLGFHQGQLSNLESGKSGDPSLSTLLRIANALECSIDDLVVDVDAAYESRSKAIRQQNELLRKFAALVLVARNRVVHEALPAATLTEILRVATAVALIDEKIQPNAIPPEGIDLVQGKVNAELSRAAARLGMVPSPSRELVEIMNLWERLDAEDRAFTGDSMRYLADRREVVAPPAEADTQSAPPAAARPVTTGRSRSAKRG